MAKENRSTLSETEVQAQYQESVPNLDLQNLDRLIGTWKISDPSGKAAITGQVSYEWREGGFFLMQHFDLVHDSHRNKGIELIGHLQLFGEEPGEEIKTRVYS